MTRIIVSVMICLCIASTAFSGSSIVFTDIYEIQKLTSSMTSIRMKQYFEENTVIVKSCGWISDVKNDPTGNNNIYVAFINMQPPIVFSLDDIYLNNIPKDVAYKLSKGEKVKFSGRVKMNMKTGGNFAIIVDYINIEKTE